MKRTFLFIISMVMLALSNIASAQNMTQLEAIDMLTGSWMTNQGVSFTLTNQNQPQTRTMTVSGTVNKQYDYWSIHTNTHNYETGTIQATNKTPFLNDNYKYRKLTQNSCEILINGQWQNATKGGRMVIQTNNEVQRPVTNDVRPVTNVMQPATNNARPATNNVRPATNNVRPATNNVQPATNNVQPTTNNVQPTTNNVRPTTNDVRPVTNNGTIDQNNNIRRGRRNTNNQRINIRR